MAEEFQGGICSGTWWNLPSKSLFSGCTSPGTAPIADIATFGWVTEPVDIIKAREDSDMCSLSNFQNHHQYQKLQQADSDSALTESSLQMMGFGLSSSTSSDWNQSFLQSNGRAESFNSVLQEHINSSTGQDSSVTVFKPISQDFPFDQQPVTTSSGSYNYPTTTAALLQTLFDQSDDPQPPPEPSLFDNRSMNYTAESYGGASSNEQLSPSWPKLPPFFRPASLLKQQPAPTGLHFTNNAPFWNASTASLSDGGVRFSASSQPQFLQTAFNDKLPCPSQRSTKSNGEVRDSGSTAKKGSNETPTLKRARIETPSPLPTFKVRKEKLGDRITALQQLVSPFGKTDTASVLYEAIEYIKFLHDQVSVLSTPYMKQGGSPIQHQQINKNITSNKSKDPEGRATTNQDLRSRGLCLVPISSTFPVATETTADFWTPTFGATFK